MILRFARQCPVRGCPQPTPNPLPRGGAARKAAHGASLNSSRSPEASLSHGGVADRPGWVRGNDGKSGVCRWPRKPLSLVSADPEIRGTTLGSRVSPRPDDGRGGCLQFSDPEIRGTTRCSWVSPRPDESRDDYPRFPILRFTR